MTGYADNDDAARDVDLTIYGGFHASTDDDLPPNTKTVLLLGPNGPDFWDTIHDAPEFSDGQDDPLDRWSTRIIGNLAKSLGAHPVFPFSGPPYQPFIAWATRSGRCFSSPVGLLVHDETGLMLSYRGALALTDRIELPETRANPCETCAGTPCITACPVGAMTPEGYDVPACKTFLGTPAGLDCMTQGCAVRRACPVSQSFGRRPAQSAFHMKAFNPS